MTHTQAQIDAAAKAIKENLRTMDWPRLAEAALAAAAEVGEAGIGGPTAEQVNNIVNVTIERCAQEIDIHIGKLIEWRDKQTTTDARIRVNDRIEVLKEAAAAIRALKEQP